MLQNLKKETQNTKEVRLNRRLFQEEFLRRLNEQNIKIFYDLDDAKTTFEKVLFYENEEWCIELFNDNALDFMLKNKTESAFNLVEKDVDINVPEYIKGAITWINE